MSVLAVRGLYRLEVDGALHEWHVRRYGRPTRENVERFLAGLAWRRARVVKNYDPSNPVVLDLTR